MADFAPKPTRTVSGTLAPMMVIATATGSTTAFTASAFDPGTSLIVLQVTGASAYFTTDGTTAASATHGLQLYLNQAYHWNVATAQGARFIAASGTGTVVAAQFQVFDGDTELTDTAVIKMVPI